MLFKLDHFPNVRGENKKSLSCHHLVEFLNTEHILFGNFKLNLKCELLNSKWSRNITMLHSPASKNIWWFQQNLVTRKKNNWNLIPFHCNTHFIPNRLRILISGWQSSNPLNFMNSRIGQSHRISGIDIWLMDWSHKHLQVPSMLKVHITHPSCWDRLKLIEFNHPFALVSLLNFFNLRPIGHPQRRKICWKKP